LNDKVRSIVLKTRKMSAGGNVDFVGEEQSVLIVAAANRLQ
jgi:hypothetical protein